ncbi:Pro-kumamolisin, activation domain-containing protein [Pterulicium gracile]|uniref:Pro-kumamolisin, activation domain-containing protein n=1 Tax=Pterulicium gracile TaxID=1884261 RepID=A0A5C3QJQ2_9AGAR|nr:Pro-kumamolisin, activation domain-containing protein [Pterula gracilis]
MIFARLILLALISVALANPLLGDVHRRRADVPGGFTAGGFAPQDDTITRLPGLEKALYAAATPGSAQYGQYLSKDQVNGYAAPSEEAVASISSWLDSDGLSLSSLSTAGDWIYVKATVGQANRLLQAEFTRYEAEGIDNTVVRALSYSIPNIVKDYISAVHPTTVFPPLRNHRMQAVRNVTRTRSSDDPDSAHLFSRAETSAIPPSCMPGSNEDSIVWNRPRSLDCRFDLYGIPYFIVGTPVPGISLWISGYDNEFASKNLTKEYLKTWRPDLVDREMFKLVTINGGLNNQIPGGAGLFATSAVSTAMSTVANTPVTFMSVGTDNSGDYIEWLIDQANYLLGLENPPQVLVGGWSMPELDLDPAIARSLCNSYAQLAARGVAVLSSVMVHGVEDGTFEEIHSDNSGDISDHFSRPTYQDAAVTPYLEALELSGVYEGLYNPSGRAKRSVDGVYGSTSFSTSFFGSMVALLNEELITAGKPALGFLNPFIYQNLDAFNDFTTGNNPSCDTPGFNATTRWDSVSGAGSHVKLRAAAGL